jgi:hypothetical protein
MRHARGRHQGIVSNRTDKGNHWDATARGHLADPTQQLAMVGL